ncbi:MAG: hypothetical protein IT371_11655 [Deltaproteobacteria bacterium]|nr:hypothetical protein [Deltaproteobacteria bacterium]
MSARAATAFALLAVAGCLGYEATPPPAATLAYQLDLPRGSTAEVTVYDPDDQIVGRQTAGADGANELSLRPSLDFPSIRLVARAGNRVLKAVAAELRRGERRDLGRVDGKSTAHAQLVQEKVAGQGGAFSSVPPSVIASLLAQARGTGAELRAFEAVVAKLLGKTSVTGQQALFGPLDAELKEPFLGEAKLPESTSAEYRNALTAATERLAIQLSCDAALVNVMFTVDASGQALDGNGAPQLVRQPTKAGKVFLAITVEDSSPIGDGAGRLKPQMVPNDPDTAMFDDGTNGDEVAGDGVFTRVLVLPRGMRVKYKYTNGSAGEGWTRTEEWPGNARLLEVKDVVSRHADGAPDCLVIRRDSFGDEASNKNQVNLNARIKGGSLDFARDLGGAAAASVGEGRVSGGGLGLGDPRTRAPLTPEGVPEAAENGTCARCPAPLTAALDDRVPPELVSAEFTSTERIQITFSEVLEFGAASTATNYLVLDAAERALPIRSAAASGSRVTLEVGPPDFGQRYTVHVKGLRDASANGNPLRGRTASVLVGRDRTPPQLIGVRPTSLRELNPAAKVADPTVGQVVVLTFDEELDPESAENAGNYRMVPLGGERFATQAAYLRDRRQVWVVTDPQGKRRPYDLFVKGVRDLAGNLHPEEEPRRVQGFALYRMTFGAVPGFAFLNLDGSRRGLPDGEGLYLTGTVLAVARDLQGNPISVAGRTDVTGIPAFEMKPGGELHRGQPVYTLSLLVPAGTYAWKVAHGIEGEYKNPPSTLVKVHKSLCTTSDVTAVEIDPSTLTALPLPGADGKAVSFLDYGAAKLSASGTEAPGPFVPRAGEQLPRPQVMFRRENPDEVCSAHTGDVLCPPILVGTWRDLEAFRVGDKTNDYDDGLPEVAPTRLAKDLAPPKLQNLRVRDSESLLLSFDERLVVDPSALALRARHARSGQPLSVKLEKAGTIGDALLPHQLLLRTGRMENGVAYTLSFGSQADVFGNVQRVPQEQSFVAPSGFVPFTPLADTQAPRVIGVLPRSPTSLLVQFDEKIAPAAGGSTASFAIVADGGAAPQIQQASLQGGGTSVLLTTGLQAQQAAYTLVVTNVSDLAAPPNVLLEQRVAFKGFGDSTPPKVVYAVALSQTEVAVAFDEQLSPLTAGVAGSYRLPGLAVVQADFAGDPGRKAAAFDGARASFPDRLVVLQVSKMTAGQSYTVTPAGVTDLSNNPCQGSATFKGVDRAPTVDVVLSYKVSGSDTVMGAIPARAIGLAALAAQREGVFIQGSTVSTDGLTKGQSDAVSTQLGGFPPEGAPLAGSEPQLLDNGQNGDAKAGDGVYSLRIRGVPLGASLQWKAFAPFTVSYKAANPGDAQAAFADATPGPSVFSDGQEFPGNENALRILGDVNGDGVVRIQCLFGDETTYKKFTNKPPFVWVADDVTWTP